MYRKHVGRALILALLLSGNLSVDAQGITRQFKNVSLKTVLSEVEKELQYSIIYKKDEVNEHKQISGEFNNASLEEVLSAILDKELTYSIQGKMIVISKKSRPEPVVNQQKQREIKGVMRDESGQPIAGANVIEVGTTNGTVTDINGNFLLTVDNRSTIRFSYIGYHEQNVAVAGKSTFSIILQEDSKMLDELVVVGFGSMKKSDLTGAVSAVQGEDLMKRVDVSNTTTALQGMSPGLTIQNFAGEPGREDIRMRVRGNGTLNNSNPLVLVDGVERSLSTVEPGDIESMTILKDAASSAIYGSRAANGVILITTKRGAKAKTIINYQFNMGFQNVLGYPKAADKVSWLKLENEAQVNAGSPPIHTQEHIDNVAAGTNPLDFPFTVYEDYLFHKNAPQQRHAVSLSSGGENGKIFASVNFLNQDGIINRFNQKRLSARINSDLYITNNLTASFNLN